VTRVPGGSAPAGAFLGGCKLEEMGAEEEDGRERLD